MNRKKNREKFSRTPQELWDKYESIFPSKNRNAASHRWTYEIMKYADKMSYSEIMSQFQAFCPVSGSPTSQNSPVFKIELPTTTGSYITGVLKHCCWPCVCDIKDAAMNSSLRVHQHTVQLKDENVVINFLVMDDPCIKSIVIPEGAPDVTCDANDKLINAVYFNTREGIKIAIGILHHEKDINTEISELPLEQCDEREKQNYNSGMGDMFRVVSGL